MILSINDTQHNSIECCYTEHEYATRFYIVMPNVIMLSVIMLSVIMLSVMAP